MQVLPNNSASRVTPINHNNEPAQCRIDGVRHRRRRTCNTWSVPGRWEWVSSYQLTRWGHAPCLSHTCSWRTCLAPGACMGPGHDSAFWPLCVVAICGWLITRVANVMPILLNRGVNSLPGRVVSDPFSTEKLFLRKKIYISRICLESST